MRTRDSWSVELHAPAGRRSRCSLPAAERGVRPTKRSNVGWGGRRRRTLMLPMLHHGRGFPDHEQGRRLASRGRPVIVLESIKMWIPVEAPRAGKVIEIKVAEGQTVQEGDTVAVLN